MCLNCATPPPAQVYLVVGGMGGVGWGSYLSSTELLIAGEAAWKLFGVGRLPVGVSGPRATTVANIVYTSGKY